MSDVKQENESQKPGEEELTSAMEQELTDEQLLQMAEGSCSWGANCNASC